MMEKTLQAALNGYTKFGVGSLPFESEVEALDFIRSNRTLLPYWPELPRKDPAERMLARAERASHPRWEGYTKVEAAGLYSMIDLIKSGVFPARTLKCQVLGPLTMSLVSEKLAGSFEGKLIEARESCYRQIRWQYDLLRGLNLNLLMVLDEPCLGSGLRLTDEEWELAESALTYLYTRTTELGVFLGIHSCSAHTRRMFELPLDLYSFDLRAEYDIVAFEREIVDWQALVRRGVVLVPGVYRSTTVEGDLGDELKTGLLIEQQVLNLLNSPSAKVLFSPSCGMASAGPEWCRKVYQD